MKIFFSISLTTCLKKQRKFVITFRFKLTQLFFRGNNRFSSRQTADYREKEEKEDREEKFIMLKDSVEIKPEAKDVHGKGKKDNESANTNDKVDEPAEIDPDDNRSVSGNLLQQG